MPLFKLITTSKLTNTATVPQFPTRQVWITVCFSDNSNILRIVSSYKIVRKQPINNKKPNVHRTQASYIIGNTIVRIERSNNEAWRETERLSSMFKRVQVTTSGQNTDRNNFWSLKKLLTTTWRQNFIFSTTKRR